MKKNSKPELTPSWWNGNKPKAWSDGRLEMALSAYVKGLNRLEQEKSQEALELANDLLDQVEKHVAASEKVAGEKPKKEPKDYDAEDFSNTAEVLQKFGGCVKLERKRLEDLIEADQSEDDEEDDKGMLLDEDAYKKYLKQKMKKIQSKAFVFALALSKPSNPEEHRFLFHKSKDGKKLGMQILDQVEGLEMKKLTWGMASADPLVGSTLVLRLDHKQLPGMVKQGNKFLKAFKPLPFDTIKLVSAETGAELKDLPDPEDAAADIPDTVTGEDTQPSTPSPKEKPNLLARLNALIPLIKEFAVAADIAGNKAGADLEAKKVALAPKNRLLTLVRDCKGMISTNDEQADAMLVDIEGILKQGNSSVTPPKEKPDLLARLNALIPRIKEFAAAADVEGNKAGADLEAKKVALAPKNRLLTLVRDCKGMIGTNDEQAEAMLADIENLLNGGQVDVATTTTIPEKKPSLMARLNGLTPRIKEFAVAADAAGNKAGEDLEAKKVALAPKNRLLTLVRDCKGMIGTNDEQAEAMLADIEVILNSEQIKVAPSTAPTTALDRWSAARGDALAKLQAELKEILATQDPDASKAELELQSVRRQLNAKMETQREAAEMERYLDQNDVVAAIDILGFSLKQPLLDLLSEIKPTLQA